MSVKRKPGDAQSLAIELLFERWEMELEQLEGALGEPQVKAIAPDAPPGSPPSEERKALMRERLDVLHPLARELADVYLTRLDAEQRRRVQRLLAQHRRVTWSFTGVIDDYFDRFTQSLAQGDFDIVLALIAIYDERAASRDFSLLAYPFYLKIRKLGLDPAELFRAGLALATRYDDPERGAYGLFARYSVEYSDEDLS